MSTLTDDQITQKLQQLRTQLNKKQTFESSVSSLKSLLLQSYPSSSDPTKKLFFDVISRVSTVLRTRYTAPGFLASGIDLLDTSLSFLTDPAEVSHLKSCLSSLRETFNPDEQHERDFAPQRRGFLFEGHLTVDPEPPQPNWLVQQNLLAALQSQNHPVGSSDTSANANDANTNNTNSNNDDDDAEVGTTNDNEMGSLLRGLVESLEVSMMEGIEDFLPEGVGARRAAPPASKEVVEKLPVVKVDETVLSKVGEDAECCICKEKLGVGDEMQEMPCRHLFHPLCLKPWLDEHNSCPICRHELPTDDHKYESWKEREKELEEERRGAANALRGGEFMYI